MPPALRGIGSMATRGLLADVAAAYARASGVTVSFLSAGGVEAARRIADGEVFDLAVLAASAIDRLAAQGGVDGAARVAVAASGIGVAVAAGAATFDIGDEAALRDALRTAGRIAYSTGPSGHALLALLQRWGLADELAPRLVQAPAGTPVGTVLARGEADLGLQQMSELIGLPGIRLLGPLPAPVQVRTVFWAAPCTSSPQPAATRTLLGFMASTALDELRARHGLEPPTPG